MFAAVGFGLTGGFEWNLGGTATPLFFLRRERVALSLVSLRWLLQQVNCTGLKLEKKVSSASKGTRGSS